MTDVTARLSPEPLRFLWPKHTAKRISQRFSIAFETARDWLREGVPHHRREEMARVVHAELDEIERQVQRWRTAQGGGDLARREADGDRPQADELGR